MFCKEKQYSLLPSTSVKDLADILCDFGYNMKKVDGENYKEYSVKTIWNTTAKILQEKYFKEYGIKFNPFEDIEFKIARDAKNTLRKTLQQDPTKRKRSADALKLEEITQMIESCEENTPDGLQKKFFHIASYELAWRGGEGAKCMIYYFHEELKNDGMPSNRIIYNPIFTKTCQGGEQRCAENKWLTENIIETDKCPVRLFKKLISKRSDNIKTDRLFLTPNPYWSTEGAPWYKNIPVGKNEIAKWTTKAAESIGLDINCRKITNHSKRYLFTYFRFWKR